MVRIIFVNFVNVQSVIVEGVQSKLLTSPIEWFCTLFKRVN